MLEPSPKLKARMISIAVKKPQQKGGTHAEDIARQLAISRRLS
jgi:hypothetical protein